MKLKRVKIIGFKTFADRTEIDFEGDLIAIVGPNGCGKSNIVDAILWGLGEPNSRHLRAATSVDVIFNGSSKRKPLGFAEVTLIFDNEDSMLPIAAAEVAITRRVTRAGDSSYSINRKACRLKDIFDLLADSGLGRAGYSIVGQREIDQALSASAEDRRAWIDEAAGVQRFRVKRLESIKRLEESAVHLSRVEQLINDLQIQREPLEAEAIVAEEFLRLRDALASLETTLLTNDVKKAVLDVEALEKKITDASNSIRSSLEISDSMELKQSEYGQNIAELERKFDAIRELRQSQITNSERAEAEIKMAHQRIASLQDLRNTLTNENESADVLQSEAAEIAERERAEYEATKATLAELLELVGSSASSAKQIQDELTQIDGEIESLQIQANDYMRWQAEQAQLTSRAKSINSELMGIVDSLPDLQSQTEITESELVSLVAIREERSLAVANAKSGLNGHEESKSESSKNERLILANIAQLQGRAHGIEATIEAHEGMSQGAQAVMGLVARGDLTGEFMPVVDAINSPVELAQAIETALGGNIHDIIVEDDRQAKAAIQLLKDRRLGRATFQPLSMLRPSQRHSELRNLTQRPGCIGVAADLVDCEARFRPVVESLLGRILVCETIDDALKMSKTQGWSRLVTLDGEVVHFAGSVTGGKNNKQIAGLVSRRAELGEIQNQLADLDHKLKDINKDSEQYESIRNKFTEQIQKAEIEFNEQVSKVREQEDWLRKLKGELQLTEKERDRLIREKNTIQIELDKKVEAPVQSADLVQKRDEIFTQSVRQSTDVEMARKRLVEAEESNRNAKRRFEEALQRQRQAENSTVKRSQRLSEIETESAQFLAQIDRFKEQSQAAMQRSEMNAEQLKVIEAERLELVGQSLKLSEELKQVQHSINQTTLLTREFEIERVRAESKRTNAVQRLTEEYGLSQEDAMEFEGIADIGADAQTTVNKLRREMRALGNVNIGAVEAFKNLTTRFNELSAQYDDISGSKAEIEKAIRELDRLTREKFLTAFETVRREFSLTFNKLFGGGEADLSLTDTEHLLSAGVNIDVTIPGKKRQRLELLSGGERSLCACAFLFALLRTKPSPIVILDEVDAPLDGRNVERYIELMKSFVGTTQFLMITHNPVTIEAAPVWFGVTMQEPGVSMILPYRAPENMALGQVVVNDKFLKAPAGKQN